MTEYPVFIDGEKVATATSFSYEIDVDTRERTVGPMEAKINDKEYGERVIDTLGSSVSFTLDCLIDPTLEPIDRIEVAVPKDGEWEVIEFVDPILSEMSADAYGQQVEGVALDMNAGRTRYLGHDVATPDRVTYGSSTKPGVTTTVHAADDSDDAGTVSDDADDEPKPEWMEDENGFSATKHEVEDT